MRWEFCLLTVRCDVSTVVRWVFCLLTVAGVTLAQLWDECSVCCLWQVLCQHSCEMNVLFAVCGRCYVNTAVRWMFCLLSVAGAMSTQLWDECSVCCLWQVLCQHRCEVSVLFVVCGRCYVNTDVRWVFCLLSVAGAMSTQMWDERSVCCLWQVICQHRCEVSVLFVVCDRYYVNTDVVSVLFVDCGRCDVNKFWGECSVCWPWQV